MNFDVSYVKFETDLVKKYQGKPFNLNLPRFRFSKGNGRNVLIIMDKPSREDLNDKKLLGNSKSGVVFRNILNHVLKTSEGVPSEILVCNLQDCSYSKEEGAELKHKGLFVSRIKEIIKAYDPSHIMLMGSRSANTFLAKPLKKLAPALESEEFLPEHVIGRFIKVKYGKKRIPTIATLSINLVSNEYHERYEDLGVYPNLIGHIVHHMETFFHGKNRWTVDSSGMVAINVDTVAKFDRFFAKLMDSSTPCIDTETRNLNRLDNQLLSIQFSLDGIKGYFIPIGHPQSPFSPSETTYIREKLVEFFEFGKTKYLIFQNAKFDLLQIRNQLKPRVINHKIYDISVGEFILDENRVFRQKIGMSGFSLAQFTLEYGDYSYFSGDENEMSKSERTNIASVDIKRLAKYGIRDTVIPYQICKFQIKEAKRRGKNYSMFLKAVTETVSDIIHVIVAMESNGILVDRQFLMEMLSPNSPFHTLLKENSKRFYTNKNVIKANKILLKGMSAPTKSMFGEDESWVFKIGEVKSQQTLFFDVLGLEPLEERATGGGKVNSDFQKEYKDVEEVKLFTEYNKLTKLHSTYIKGFHEKISSNPDMRIDNHMRPIFNYTDVITGRISAQKPSLQQVPSRTDAKKQPEIAKMVSNVKRQFIAARGELFIKADYSAHEVRNWAIIALDQLLAESFRKGLLKWREYRLLKEVTDEIRAEWEGTFKSVDIHRINHSFFFGTDPAKVDGEERSKVKAVVFGVIYDLSTKSLAEGINDTPEAAQALIDLMFRKFKTGAAWIKHVKKVARESCELQLVNGRVRHLWGNLHWDRTVHNMMTRRTPNSAIQGPSSDEGFTGGRNLQLLIWDYLDSQGQPFSFKHRNAVHDSIESTALAKDIPIACYLMEHAYTSLVAKKYREVFNHKFIVDLQMEMDIGPSLAVVPTWDYRVDSQCKLIEDGLVWANENLRRDVPVAKIMKSVLKNSEIIYKWRRKELKKMVISKEGANELMLITKDNVLDLGYNFALKSN